MQATIELFPSDEKKVSVSRDMLPSYFEGKFTTLGNNVARVLNGKSQQWLDQITPSLKAIKSNDVYPEKQAARIIRDLAVDFELNQETTNELLKIYLGDKAEV